VFATDDSMHVAHCILGDTYPNIYMVLGTCYGVLGTWYGGGVVIGTC